VVTYFFSLAAYDMPPIASLYEVTSALGTAGVSSGLTSAELPTTLKLVLIFNMLLGRVETVAIIVLLLPATWIGKRRS
jgi:trk system potassium uptake protein TrkH